MIAPDDLMIREYPKGVSQRLYRVLTIDPESGEWTPQIGCPGYVQGFSGLRGALRTLRGLGYDVHRDVAPSVLVEAVECEAP